LGVCFVTAARRRVGKGEAARVATESARSSRAGPSRRDRGVGRARTVCPTEVRGEKGATAAGLRLAMRGAGH
jgi:hypothetical protein